MDKALAASEEIKRLRTRITDLENGLRPFANSAKIADERGWNVWDLHAEREHALTLLTEVKYADRAAAFEAEVAAIPRPAPLGGIEGNKP